MAHASGGVRDQTLPSVLIGLYTRRLHRSELIIGRTTGMVYGMVEAQRTPGDQTHFGAKPPVKAAR